MYTPAKSTTARILARPLRLLTFLLTLFILAISAYHIHNLRPNISGTLYAVTILSALTVLLLLISSFLSSILLAIITDLTLSAFSIAISILLRNVAQQKCAGQIDCYLDTTAFSAAIANAYALPRPDGS